MNDLKLLLAISGITNADMVYVRLQYFTGNSFQFGAALFLSSLVNSNV